MQDPGLADTGLRGPPGLPRDEMVAAVAKPTVQVGNVSRSNGPPQDGVRDAVELDEHDAGHVGHIGTVSTLTRLARRTPVEVCVVVECKQRRDRRGHDDQADNDDERRPEAVDLDTRQQLQYPCDEQCIEDDRTETKRQHRERHDEERECRPDDCVGETDHESGQ